MNLKLTTLIGGIGACLILSCASAQTFQPIDPLVRPKHGQGGYSITSSIGYSPSVTYTQDTTYTRNALSFNLSGMYNLTDRLSLYGSWGAGATLRQKLTAGDASGTQAFSFYAPNIGLQYEFAGKYAPTVATDVTLPLFGQPWQAGIGVSASLLHDPMIVDFSLSERYTAEIPDKTIATHDLSAGLGLEFVINDRFTLRGDVTQGWQVGRIVIPSTDVSTSLSYKLSEQSSLRASVGVNAIGSETAWRTGLSYSFRK